MFRDVATDSPRVTAADDKPERVSLVELKNGKLVLKQKLLSFEKMSETMQGTFHAERALRTRPFVAPDSQRIPRDCTIPRNG